MSEVGKEDVEEARPLSHPTIDDFLGIDLQEPIAGCRAADCHEFTTPFVDASRKAGSEGDLAKERVYAFLGSLTGLHFKPGDVAAFGPMMTMGDKRTAIPEDFRGEPTQAPINAAPKILNTSLRARLADVAWINSRNGEIATIAWSSYLALITEIIDGTALPFHGRDEFNIMEATQFLTRALRIAQQTSKRGISLPAAFSDAHEKIFASEDILRSPVWAVRLLELGVNYGLIETAEAIQRLSSLRDQLGTDANPHTVRGFLLAMARLHKREGSREDANELRRQAAEEFVKLAGGQQASGMLASHWLMDAIAELVKIPGTRSRRDELRALLRKAQEDSLSEMSPLSHEMDISDLVENALAQVDNLSLGQSLGVFSDMLRSRKVSMLEEQAKNSIRDFPLSSMFGSSHLDDEGKVVGKAPGASFGEDGPRAQIDQVIARNEGIYRHLCVTGTIEPARQSIQARYGPTEIDIWPIVRESPFVPPDAEAAYVLGITAFLHGDFLSSVHVLVPHVEDSLRYILRQHGIETANILTDGVQEDQGLPVILERHREPLENVLGVDLFAEINRLFVDDLGPKIRHAVAHGKASRYSNSADYIYSCWLIYRIVCLPLYGIWGDIDVAIGRNRLPYKI